MEPRDASIIGIIPAGGVASRLGHLPCSKELLPIPCHSEHPIPVGTFLINNLKRAGASQINWVIRKGKWDIPQYYGSGRSFDIPMCYNIMEYPHGPPFTINESYSNIRGKIVLLGFPDILIDHPNPFVPLINEIRQGNFEVTLGIVHCEDPKKIDVVEMNDDGEITKIIPKPKTDVNKQAWIWAAWSPRFTEFLHHVIEEKVESIKSNESIQKEVKELHVGDVMQQFINAGGKVKGIKFQETRFLDIGTTSGWKKIEQFRFLKHPM